MSQITKYGNIVLWGDSIGRGVRFADGRYSVMHDCAVNRAIQAGLKLESRAKMGLTADKGHAILTKDLASGIQCNTAVIEFGGNDSNFTWKEVSERPEDAHLPWVTPEAFEWHMRGMTDELRAYGANVIMVSLPPIDSAKYFKFISHGLNGDNILKWLGDEHHIYRYHELYSAIIMRLSREYNCPLLDLRYAFLKHWGGLDYLCEDGIHPNAAGQELIWRVAEEMINAG